MLSAGGLYYANSASIMFFIEVCEVSKAMLDTAYRENRGKVI